jgi:hypothetical protein
MKKPPSPGQDAYSGTMDPLNQMMLPMYLCPSDGEMPQQAEKFGNAARKQMSYVGISGSYYARTGKCVTSPVGNSWKQAGQYCISGSLTGLLGPNNYDGLLIQDWKVSIKQVSDGTSKTLLLGERWYEQRAWMIGAYSLDTATDPSGGSGRGAVVLAPNGPQPYTAWFSCKNLSDKAPINLNLVSLCYQDHDNTKDRPSNLPASCKTNGLSVADIPFGSFHPGGACFAYGDGSVKFLPDDININTYLALGSRNDGDAVSE